MYTSVHLTSSVTNLEIHCRTHGNSRCLKNVTRAAATLSMMKGQRHNALDFTAVQPTRVVRQASYRLKYSRTSRLLGLDVRRVVNVLLMVIATSALYHGVGFSTSASARNTFSPGHANGSIYPHEDLQLPRQQSDQQPRYSTRVGPHTSH
jgi:hypothetical protein